MSTLSNQANAIIEQLDHTDDDITKLQRIKFKMSLLYSDNMKTAGMSEQMYNSMRASEYIKVKQNKRGDGKSFTDNEADKIAKNRAEETRGQYRTIICSCKGMYAVIRAIETFCMDYYTKRKAEYSASITN